MFKRHIIAITCAAVLCCLANVILAEKTNKLTQVFDPKMLDADLAFFEQVTGPARNTHKDTKTYEVEGCEVRAMIQNGTIAGLRIELSEHCDFDLNKFLPNLNGKLPSLQTMTFGNFDSVANGGGQFYADCISACGNAFDPSVYYHWSGSRADNFWEVMLEALQVTDPVSEAVNVWRSEMEKKEGNMWVMKAQFNCTRHYDDIARRAFKDVKISGIAIGRNLQVPQCIN